MECNASPDAPMRSGDQIVVLGKPDGLRELEQVARGTPPLGVRA
jgi:Trk K+ transport system NAD-binding subunit